MPDVGVLRDSYFKDTLECFKKPRRFKVFTQYRFELGKGLAELRGVDIKDGSDIN